jgi:hypothetical protein
MVSKLKHIKTVYLVEKDIDSSCVYMYYNIYQTNRV